MKKKKKADKRMVCSTSEGGDTEDEDEAKCADKKIMLKMDRVGLTVFQRP